MEIAWERGGKDKVRRKLSSALVFSSLGVDGVMITKGTGSLVSLNSGNCQNGKSCWLVADVMVLSLQSSMWISGGGTKSGTRAALRCRLRSMLSLELL